MDVATKAMVSPTRRDLRLVALCGSPCPWLCPRLFLLASTLSLSWLCPSASPPPPPPAAPPGILEVCIASMPENACLTPTPTLTLGILRGVHRLDARERV